MDEFRKSFVETSKKFFACLRGNPETMSKTLKELGFDSKYHWNESNGSLISTIMLSSSSSDGSKEPQMVTVCEMSEMDGNLSTVVILNGVSFLINDSLINETMNPIFSFMKDAVRIFQINSAE